MRKLIMKMSITVDGFVADVNGKADWIFRSSDETSRAWSLERSYDASLVIMGRKSFECMAPYWPTAAEPFATPMNEIPKAVFTKSGYKGINVDPIQNCLRPQLPGHRQRFLMATWPKR